MLVILNLTNKDMPLSDISEANDDLAPGQMPEINSIDQLEEKLGEQIDRAPLQDGLTVNYRRAVAISNQDGKGFGWNYSGNKFSTLRQFAEWRDRMLAE